jgi:hypothetical protein
MPEALCQWREQSRAVARWRYATCALKPSEMAPTAKSRSYGSPCTAVSANHDHTHALASDAQDMQAARAAAAKLGSAACLQAASSIPSA